MDETHTLTSEIQIFFKVRIYLFEIYILFNKKNLFFSVLKNSKLNSNILLIFFNNENSTKYFLSQQRSQKRKITECKTLRTITPKY